MTNLRGKIIATRNNGILSRLICWAQQLFGGTQGRWSHVGIMLDNEAILETTGVWVGAAGRIVPLSKYVKGKFTIAFFYPTPGIFPRPSDNEIHNAIHATYKEIFNKSYDWHHFFRGRNDPQRYICSEAVYFYVAHLRKSINRLMPPRPEWLTPDWITEQLEMTHILMNAKTHYS